MLITTWNRTPLFNHECHAVGRVASYRIAGVSPALRASAKTDARQTFPLPLPYRLIQDWPLQLESLSVRKMGSPPRCVTQAMVTECDPFSTNYAAHKAIERSFQLLKCHPLPRGDHDRSVVRQSRHTPRTGHDRAAILPILFW
jgi:hypothetical protein